jgi:hypothetical protein
VIPARNAGAHLARCLDALARQGGPLEIVVADNGSSDDTAAIARRRGARVVDAPALTVSAVRNLGARIGAADVIAFVDADNEVADGWLDACRSAFSEPAVGAAGLPYTTTPDATWVQRAYDALRVRPTTRVDVHWLGAGNLAVRREAFERAGGFDESLQTCEDVALCATLRSCGYRVIAEPRMASVHHGDPETLKALFLGELWRGRDNVRVSLRSPITWRGLASLAASGSALAAAVGVVASLLASPWVGVAPLAMAALLLLTVTALRAGLLLRRMPGRPPVGVLPALLVGGTYELARGCSLMVSASHDTRAGEA